MSDTRHALRTLAAPLARRARLAGLAAAATAALVLLAVGAWGARLGLLSSPAWVPLAWLAAGVALTAVVVFSRHAWIRWTDAGVAGWLEQGGRWRSGALSGFLQPAAPGTSEGLLRHADHLRAEELAARGALEVEPVARPLGRRLGLAVLGVLASALLLGASRPWTGPPAALWHPARALRDALEPVRLAADSGHVDRGGTVRLTVEAPGRQDAVLWTRSPGETWRRVDVTLDGAGRAALRVGPLTSDLYARATAGGRGSDTLHVEVRLPAFLGSLVVTARYPAYLGMDDEPMPTGGDTLLLPAGTALETRGEATADLASARWRQGDGLATMEVGGATFTGRFVPRSGTHTLELVTAAGGALGGDPVVLPIRIVADSAPAVDLPVPGADTVAPASMRLPIVVDARDDHGLRSLRLDVRTGRTGARALAIPLPAGSPDRAILGYELDLDALGLRAGDTLFYRGVAVDTRPGGGVGRSREYAVRIPSDADLRAAQREAMDAIQARLDSLADDSRAVARQTSELAREQQRSAASGTTTSEALGFEEKQRAEAAGEATEQLMQEAEELRDAVEALEEAARRAGLDDPAFQQRLQEVREQLERALTPELRERLAELQRALGELDADQARQALEDLAEAQERLREALERSRELFERAALEGEMAALADEARDLAGDQAAWNADAERGDSAAAADAEAALAERADSLAADLAEAASDEQAAEASDALEQAAQQATQAAEQMRQASRQMQQGNRQGAAQSGQQAEEMLQPMAEGLDQAREQMASEWRQEIMDALDRGLAETSRLVERQLGLEARFRAGAPSAEARSDQAAVEEGVERLAEQMRIISGRNALVSQQISAALTAAQQEMARAREAVSSAVPNQRQAGERAGSAVDALNAAAYQMIRSKDDVAGSGSGSGMAEAMERMSQLAGQQGQVGQQSASLLPTAGQGQRQQMQGVAAEQRAVAEALERLRAEGGMPAAGALAEEARELARRLESGRLDRQTVERQQRLFQRMLDAGRTLEGQERDEQKERQSTTAEPGEISLPPALRDRLLGDGARVRVPGWDELQRLSPDERRIVLDYFRHLTEQQR